MSSRVLSKEAPLPSTFDWQRIDFARDRDQLMKNVRMIRHPV